MAYQKPTDLDGFIAQMGKADMRIRAQLAEDLVNYLSDSENSLMCSDLGMLIDGLVPWLSGSHFKVQFMVSISIAPSVYCSTPHTVPKLVFEEVSGERCSGDRLSDGDGLREVAIWKLLNRQIR